MNKARLTELADIIEKGKPDLRFDMGTFRQCSTAGCIAGWAVAVYAPNIWADKEAFDSIDDIPDIARKLLHLSHGEADELFLGDSVPEKLSKITTAEAVSTIRNFVETGRIEWTTPIDLGDEDEGLFE